MRTLFFLCCLWCVCLSVQAGAYHKREIIRPCFVTATTTKVEVKKIILTDEQAQVDAIMYGKPGELAIVSASTCLRSGGREYPLRETAHVSIDGTTIPEEIPSSGRLHVVFSFAPLPAHAHEVDLVEKEAGWAIYGVQLTEKEPYVYIPGFLQTRKPERCKELPSPRLEAGKVVVNGYVLGYEQGMALDIEFLQPDWLFGGEGKKAVKVHRDGSFHLETDLLMAGAAKLRVNEAQLDLFLQPGGMLTVYIHLPRLSMSASRLLKATYGQQQKAWFDGDFSALNEELATWGHPLSISEAPDFADMTSGLSPEACSKWIQHRFRRYERRLQSDGKASEAYRQYVRINLQLNAACLSGGEEARIPLSSYVALGYDYLAWLEGNIGQRPVWWQELEKARNVCRSFVEDYHLASEEKKQLKTIGNPAIRQYVESRLEIWEAESDRGKWEKGHVIATLDEAVSGEDILQTILSPYRNRLVLVDFWATWCAPCRQSILAMKALKQKLSSEEIAYVYLTGSSSPEVDWKTAIADIHGVHYRLTKEQWNYLCRSQGITGIPAFLLFDEEGKLQARYVGYPGTDALMKKILSIKEKFQ